MGEELTVVSLFSGALGLDLGLETSGFSIRVAVECNRFAAATIKRNRPDLPLIEKRIEDVPTAEILKRAGLSVGDITVVSGGPSCQSFSTAGQRASLADPRGVMFREFVRVIDEARPRFFLMENVRGMLSAAIRHRPLDKRGPGHPRLKADEVLGSAFGLILQELKHLGYFITFDVVNAADYGAPQTRERILLIGSRDGQAITLPRPSHARIASRNTEAWVTLREALNGLVDDAPECPQLSPEEQKYLTLVPPGGNWRDLPKRMHSRALGAAYVSWGGRSGFCRRLAWDAPAPALPTVPDGRATMLCHPDETRPLTVREYARLQGFPDTWVFDGGTPQKYKQIGNAVPLALGKMAGFAIRTALQQPVNTNALGIVTCSPELSEVIKKREHTILNPPRMRKSTDQEEARNWKRRSTPSVHPILQHVSPPSEIPRTSSKNAKRAHRITLALHAAYGSPNHANKTDPLDELIFIILSQMTTHPSFNRIFDGLRRGRSWSAIHRLPLPRLSQLIKNAGLSRQKAPRIKAILSKVRVDFGAYSLDALRTMTDAEAIAYLTQLPGVGVKTAKCVLMYSLRRTVLPVDTHVWRLGTRLGLVDASLGIAKGEAILEAAIPPSDRYSFHVNALSHGRAVCTALRPRCDTCDVRRWCKQQIA